MRYPKSFINGPKYPHASEPFPELQAAVAVLSTGPVGPGDAAGAANKSLLMSTCNEEGLLLKPGYPAVPAEVVFVNRAEGLWDPHEGEVNIAHTTISGKAFACVIGIDIPEAVTLLPADLGLSSNNILRKSVLMNQFSVSS